MSAPKRTKQEQFLDEIADAIDVASCKGRGEGPFGLYDYSSYPGTEAPHVVRDFRPEAKGKAHGARIAAFQTAEEAEEVFRTLTRRYIARKAFEAVEAYWVRELADKMKHQIEGALHGLSDRPGEGDSALPGAAR